MQNHSNEPMNRAPRCLARTRRGTLCQCPAMRGKKRCYRHGGAAGSGAQPGNRNAFKHGHRSAAHLEAMGLIRQFQREVAALLE